MAANLAAVPSRTVVAPITAPPEYPWSTTAPFSTSIHAPSRFANRNPSAAP